MGTLEIKASLTAKRAVLAGDVHVISFHAQKTNKNRTHTKRRGVPVKSPVGSRAESLHCALFSVCRFRGSEQRSLKAIFFSYVRVSFVARACPPREIFFFFFFFFFKKKKKKKKKKSTTKKTKRSTSVQLLLENYTSLQMYTRYNT